MALKYINNSPFPLLVCELDVPERPEDLTKRDHNKYAKEALFDAVVRWHGHRESGFPTRFQREAKTRFRHFERSEKYKRMKARKYHSTVDLIKSGDSKESMLTRVKIAVGGTAVKDTLHATATMRFAFKGGSGRFRTQGTRQEVTVERMLVELQTCDQQDAELIAKWLLEGYMQRLNNHRKTRKRIRIPKK
jgi:hypothetical protein